ncbi:hypothetical protein AOLI_G00129210 [Acnodon oligacanthus]
MKQERQRAVVAAEPSGERSAELRLFSPLRVTLRPVSGAAPFPLQLIRHSSHCCPAGRATSRRRGKTQKTRQKKEAKTDYCSRLKARKEASRKSADKQEVQVLGPPVEGIP